MPRIARQESPSSIYHVMNRGAGKQIIFEDDADKSFFVRKLAALLREHNADLLAWCLMDNHYHLLLRIEHDSLATIMHRLQTSYAGYFNRVHEHSGALFGSRFLSEPVDSDEYLLTVVRYIHENPVKAKIPAGLLYKWSSYSEYLGTARYISASLVLGMFGSRNALRTFHEASHAADHCLDFPDKPGPSITDDQAHAVIQELVGKDGELGVKALPKAERNRVLLDMRRHGLGVRQIQRLTGVPASVISRVTAKGVER